MSIYRLNQKVAGGGVSGGGGTSDYNDLSNKPTVNSVTLTGNTTSADLGLQPTIDSSHKLSSDLIDDSTATNKFVTASDKTTWNGKQDALTFDDTPTSGSTNPVTSGGVYTSLSGKVDIVSGSSLVPDTKVSSYDSHITDTTIHVTASDKETWSAKQNALTFDSSPTSGSTNPVTSGGVYTSLVGKVDLNQGVAESGKYLKVGADGVITTGSVQTITYDSENKELVIA